MNRRNLCLTPSVWVMLIWLFAVSAKAHFVWLAPPLAASQAENQPAAAPIQIYFAESPEPGDADLLERINAIQAWRVDAQHQVTPLKVNRSATEMTIGLGDDKTPQVDALCVASLVYGVMQREGEPYRLVYVAKTGPSAGNTLWNKPLLRIWFHWMYNLSWSVAPWY